MRLILIFTALLAFQSAAAFQFDEMKALADQGDARAQVNLGVMYEVGDGVPKSDAEAVKWYRKAAGQGYADAQVSLGGMYRNGKGVPENDAEAVKWYRKAAEQGSAVSQVNLGFMYRKGEGVPKNDAEAVKWYRKAADQGNASAQFELGVMYAVGEGVPVPEFIIPWFSEEGAPNNNTRAYVWWSMAKTQGHAQAATKIDKLKPQMTPQQIADGQALATKCYESNYQQCD
jgi:TPR repeat protein